MRRFSSETIGKRSRINLDPHVCRAEMGGSDAHELQEMGQPPRVLAGKILQTLLKQPKGVRILPLVQKLLREVKAHQVLVRFTPNLLGESRSLVNPSPTLAEVASPIPNALLNVDVSIDQGRNVPKLLGDCARFCEEGTGGFPVILPGGPSRCRIPKVGVCCCWLLRN